MNSPEEDGMRERSYLGAVLIAGLMLSTPLFVATPQQQSLPEGDVTMSTDKHCYSPGEEVRITATGWARLPSIGDFPDIFWAITDEYGDPVFETLNAFDMIWDFSGTLTGIWNQTYRLHNDSRSGSPVPPGLYAIWFYVIPPPPYVDWPPWIPATIVIGDCNANLKVLTDKDCYKPGEYVNITLFNAGPENLFWSAQPPSIIIFDSSGVTVKMPALMKLAYVVEIPPNSTYPSKLGWNQTYFLYDREGRTIPPTGAQVPEGSYVILVPADGPPGIAGTKSILISSDCGSTEPVADAGPEQTVLEGNLVQFDGSKSRGSIVSSGEKLPRIANYSCPWPESGNPGPPSEPKPPYTNLVTNGDFESGLTGWSSYGSVSVSKAVAYKGSSSLLVNTSASNSGYVYQRVGDLGNEFVMYLWIYVVSLSSDPMVVELIRNWDPSTGHADVTARFEIVDDGMTWTMWNKVIGKTYPNQFSPNAWHRLAFALNASAKAMCWWVDAARAACDTWPAASPFEPEYLMVGDVSYLNHAGRAYFDNLIIVGLKETNTSVAPITSYRWDFNNLADSNGDGNYTNDVDGTGPTPSWTYGDNGEFVVTLDVTDSTGRTAVDTTEVTVLNVAPAIAYTVIPSGNEADTLTFIARITDPGSDDIKVAWSGPCIGWSAPKSYPNDPLKFPDPYPSPEVNPRNVTDVQTVICGDNGLFAWTLKVEDDDGGVTTLTGDFSVANLPTFFGYTFCPQIVGCFPTRFEGNLTDYWVLSHDPGSDDVTYMWTWGDGSPSESATYFNNGVGPDPPNSPNGTFPFTSGDSRLHAFGDDGMYFINVTGQDDDGGVTLIGAAVTILNLPPSLTVSPPVLMTVDEGTQVILNATAMDPGSDDLIFTWAWQYGSTEVHPHYNNGIGPDPPNSPGGTFPFTASDNSSFTYGDNGVYLVSLIVADDDGGSITYSTTITVNNVPPTVDAVLDTTTDEGSLLSLTFSFSDPGFDYPPAGTVEDFTATVSWGDGTSEALVVNEIPGGPGVLTTGTIPASHYYADNGIYTATVTVCDDDGGCGNTSFAVTIYNVPPTVDAGADKATTEASPLSFMFAFSDPGFDFPPAGTVEDFTAIIDWGYGPSEAAMVNEIPGSPGVLTTGTITANHTYGDNGIFIVTVTVCDDDGGCGSDTLTVTIDNVPQVIDDVQVYVLANITLRVAGEKWHDVRMDLIHASVVTGTAEVIRHPGSPDDQTATISGGRIQLLGDFRIVLYYTPDDDPINGQPNGANPAWVIITLPDGSEVRFHHTFNVQHPATWTWTLDDFRPYLVGQTITLSATTSEVGSDDLTFTWSFGDGSPDATATYFNNGLSPDPYPSPEVNPITASDMVKHVYTLAGTYAVTLSVMDDDGGIVTESFVILIG